MKPASGHCDYEGQVPYWLASQLGQGGSYKAPDRCIHTCQRSTGGSRVSAVLPTYNRADVAFVRGEGPYLFAEDGQRYLDFGAGIAVNAFGHAHPKLVAALTEQAGKLWHTSNLYRVPGQEKLAAKLVAKHLRRHGVLHQFRARRPANSPSRWRAATSS